MRQTGALLVLGGVLLLGVAQFMDTTVETGGETVGQGLYKIEVPKTRVHNLGLMQQRNTALAMGALAVLAGTILSVSRNTTPPTTVGLTRKCPYCAEEVKAEAILCRYCNRDIAPIEEAKSLGEDEKREEARRVSMQRTRMELGGHTIAHDGVRWICETCGASHSRPSDFNSSDCQTESGTTT